MTPEEYCQERTHRAGSSFYYSFLFLPREKRRDITALYAFCREVDDVVDECRTDEVATTKLQWWRAELDRTYDGTPQHPVTRALQPVIERYGLAREYFHEIIDGMEMDLEESTYASFQDLALYCQRVAGVVGLLSAEIFGYEDRRTLQFAQDLGVAFQLTNILRDVREDAARGRVYIPQDEMACHCITVQDFQPGPLSDGMRRLLTEQAQRAHGYYDRALHKLPEADRHRQRSSLIMAAIYRQTLRRIETEGFPVLERRVSLSPLHKLWLAWRTARYETRRHRRFERHGLP
ncbi:MAG TPA: presqualene diphosphate synthase HpnD [Gammaproteobacteria bacterium]|nr:presqualene diphosphate synthase HpnD [Gammaproteobacteria bacterium]